MKIQLSDHFTYKRLLRFVISPIIMMVFTSIYGVVDGLFVSNYVGKTAFAAINLIMPFIMILGAIGFMFGTGGAALIASVLGVGDDKRANRYFSMIVKLTILSGIILSVLGIVFIRPIAIALGATAAMIEDCVIYSRVILIFNTFFMLQNLFQSFLVVAEKPKFGLVITLLSGFTNMLLDWIFIAIFNFGVAGAALATGISQLIGGIVPFFYFFNPNSHPIKIVKTTIELKPMLNACANGSSELLNNVSTSLVSMLYNFQLLKYAGENGVATYGVLMYVQFAFIGMFIGYSIGSAPIISYHYGAQNHAELKNMLIKSTVLMFISGFLMTIFAKILSPVFANIFVGYDAELYEMTRYAFSLFSYSFLLAGLNIFASSFFTALNNGGISAIIAFLRTMLFQTISVLVLPIFFKLNGIWLAMTVAEIFSIIVVIIFVMLNRKAYKYF